MYRSTGFISFVLRRFTGVVLVIYLFLHIWVLGARTQSAAAFDERMELLHTPFFKIAEIGLLAAVIYHGFDGIRLIIVHYFNVTEYRKSMFYAAFAISAILTVAGGLPMLLAALEI